jgi:hypothetical protein
MSLPGCVQRVLGLEDKERPIGLTEKKVPRGMVRVELPADVTADKLHDRLKDEVNKTLHEEWVFAFENIMFVEHEGPPKSAFRRGVYRRARVGPDGPHGPQHAPVPTTPLEVRQTLTSAAAPPPLARVSGAAPWCRTAKPHVTTTPAVSVPAN